MGRRRRVPGYRLHRPSGQAVVTLAGQDFYLGPHGTQVSRDEYDRVVAEWLANGRQLPQEGEAVAPLTVGDVILRYWEFAVGYYVKDGKPTGEQWHIKSVLRVVRRLYSLKPATEFGPRALKACREELVRGGLCRKTINQDTGRIKRMLRWAAENELVPASVWHGLQTVRGLQRGRTEAKEGRKVSPVPVEHVEAVKPLVSGTVRAMIELQLLTGMRPGEVTQMRGCDVERSEGVWKYRPAHHKTEHHGHERVVPMGPRAQAVVLPFLEIVGDGYVFSAKRAEEARNARRRLARESPMTPSQRQRTRKANRERAWRDRYDSDSYRRAIQRACEAAKVPIWGPNQLRHNAATALRDQFGIEAARVILGHRSAAVTEIYAEINWDRAAEVMAKVG